MSTDSLNTRTKKILRRAQGLQDEQQAALEEELATTLDALESFVHHMDDEATAGSELQVWPA